MKWHSLLKDPNDLPQRINEYDESENVLVIERCVFVNERGATKSIEFIRSDYVFYYGHWNPNGEEGWRVRSMDYCDCGKFGGFPVTTRYQEVQEESMIPENELSEFSEDDLEFIKHNCTYVPELQGWVTREIAGWTYFPNEEEFIEENKEFINQNTKVC